jgi:hypothetical protein
MIYTAPCIMFWMCAYPSLGEVGGGWALELRQLWRPAKESRLPWRPASEYGFPPYSFYPASSPPSVACYRPPYRSYRHPLYGYWSKNNWPQN